MYDMDSWILWEVNIWKKFWRDNEELAAVWTVGNIAENINHISFILLIHSLKWAMNEPKKYTPKDFQTDADWSKLSADK